MNETHSQASFITNSHWLLPALLWGLSVPPVPGIFQSKDTKSIALQVVSLTKGVAQRLLSWCQTCCTALQGGERGVQNLVEMPILDNGTYLLSSAASHEAETGVQGYLRSPLSSRFYPLPCSCVIPENTVERSCLSRRPAELICTKSLPLPV